MDEDDSGKSSKDLKSKEKSNDDKEKKDEESPAVEEDEFLKTILKQQ